MIKVDSDLPLHLICAFSCGIMTGFGAVVNKLMPPKEKTFNHLPGYSDLKLAPAQAVADTSSKTIVIFGIGAVGVGSIVGAKLAKIDNIIAVDVIPEKESIAKEAGATHYLNGRSSTEELVKQIKEISADGAGANMTLEASGSEVALANAIACLAPQGKCAGVGAPAMGMAISIDMNTMVANSLVYMGVLLGDCNTSIMLPYMVALFKKGDFDIMNKVSVCYAPSLLSLLTLTLYAARHNIQAQRDGQGTRGHEGGKDCQASHCVVIFVSNI
jgi:aryl-alcohol dehydrogenase